MNRPIGIMGAMPEEIQGVVKLLSDKKTIRMGMRTYYTGTINGVYAVVVFSRWGKVAAAATVANLVLEFKISELIFTGVAGAVHPDLKIGDIVLATRLIQHDMDARPIMNRYEIPLLKKTFIECGALQMKIATDAINDLIESKHLHSIIEEEDLNAFSIKIPKLFIGDIASGDKFFSSEKEKINLLKRLPSILCVEMEGAAVAQVCFEFNIPFTILRTISDTADEKAHIDFPSFLAKISSKYSAGIIQNILGKKY